MTKSLSVTLRARVGRLSFDVVLETGPETLVLLGPNGSGKTTLLSLLLGALAVDEGEITLGERTLLNTKEGVCLPVESRRLGYLPQGYALFSHLSVWQNVEFASVSAAPAVAKSQRSLRVGELLEGLGLSALADRRPAKLSGGERQRVALARALMASPEALLLDEPLAALDVHGRSEVRDFLKNYLGELGLPTVLVTHDADEARALGARFAVLEEGRVVQSGTWHELAVTPATGFVAAFTRSASVTK